MKGPLTLDELYRFYKEAKSQTTKLQCVTVSEKNKNAVSAWGLEVRVSRFVPDNFAVLTDFDGNLVGWIDFDKNVARILTGAENRETWSLSLRRDEQEK